MMYPRFVSAPVVFLLGYFHVSSVQVVTAACPHLRERNLQGMGHGGGGMGSGGGGMGSGGGGNGVGAIIQQLFDNRLLIDREVVHNQDGTIVTRTTSDDETSASLLQTHVETMQDRAEENLQVRRWDPFFVELFDRHDQVKVEVKNLDNGVEVLLSASTECGQALIEDHTAVVSLFVKTGREEGEKAHPVPQACLEANEDEDEPVCSSLFDSTCKGE